MKITVQDKEIAMESENTEEDHLLWNLFDGPLRSIKYNYKPVYYISEDEHATVIFTALP